MSGLVVHAARVFLWLANGAEALLARFRTALADRRAYNGTLRELRGLDDRELTDLGIGSRDFDAIARGRPIR